MNKKTIERRIKQSLAAKGVKIVPGSPADRGVKTVSVVTADLSDAGERLVTDASTTIKQVSEKVRSRVHEATRPKR